MYEGSQNVADIILFALKRMEFSFTSKKLCIWNVIIVETKVVSVIICNLLNMFQRILFTFLF